MKGETPVWTPHVRFPHGTNIIDLKEDTVALLTLNAPILHIWDLKDLWGGTYRKAGQLVLTSDMIEEHEVWVVLNVHLRDYKRHKGIMRELMRKLLPTYKELASDCSGTTTATRMWEALGAEKLKTERCPKGYVYLLRL